MSFKRILLLVVALVGAYQSLVVFLHRKSFYNTFIWQLATT